MIFYIQTCLSAPSPIRKSAQKVDHGPLRNKNMEIVHTFVRICKSCTFFFCGVPLFLLLFCLILWFGWVYPIRSPLVSSHLYVQHKNMLYISIQIYKYTHIIIYIIYIYSGYMYNIRIYIYISNRVILPNPPKPLKPTGTLKQECLCSACDPLLWLSGVAYVNAALHALRSLRGSSKRRTHVDAWCAIFC